MSDTNRGPLRVGLVGMGRFGAAWAQTLRAEPDTELVWGCDTDPLAHLSGVRKHSALATALALPGVDAAVVATPPSTHFAVAQAALLAGCHVLVEKPLTTHPAEAQRLIDLGQQLGLVVFVDHLPVFQPAFRSLVAGLASGSIGAVAAVVSERMAPRRLVTPASLEGVVEGERCPLWVLGPHDIAMLECVVGGALPSLRMRAGKIGEVVVESATSAAPAVQMTLSSVANGARRRFAVLGSAGTLVYADGAPLMRSPWTGSVASLSALWAQGAEVPDGSPVSLDPCAVTPLQFVWRAFRDAVDGRDRAFLSGHRIVQELHSLRPYPGAAP